MEREQIAVKIQRLDRAAFAVGALDLPRHEFRSGIKHGVASAQLKSILRFRAGLFAAAVKLQRVVHEKIVHRRPEAVGRAAFLQKIIVIGHGDFLENRLVDEGLVELLVDLIENAREIPRLEIVTRACAGARALQEAPAVLLEIMPVPIGENRLHHRLHFLGRLGDLRLHAANLLLRLVALDIAFERHLFANRLDGLGVILVAQCLRDDRFKMRDGRLGQPLLEGGIVRLPALCLGELSGRIRGIDERDGDGYEGQRSNEFFHGLSTVLQLIGNWTGQSATMLRQMTICKG